MTLAQKMKTPDMMQWAHTNNEKHEIQLWTAKYKIFREKINRDTL